MAIKVVPAPAIVERTRRTGETERSPLNRIQSDLRVGSQASEAAELEVSRRVKSHLHQFNRALQSANEEVSAIQTAREGLTSISQHLEGIRELLQRAREDSRGEGEREALLAEAATRLNQVEETAERFGLTGGVASLDIPLGSAPSRRVELARVDVRLGALGLTEGAAPTDADLDRAMDVLGAAEVGLARSAESLNHLLVELRGAAHNAAAARSSVARAGSARGTAHLVQEQIDRAPARAVASQTRQLPPGVLNIME